MELLRIRRGRVKRGEWLFRPGDRVQSLYTLRSGCVKEVASAHSDNEPILGFCMPGEVLGLPHAGAKSFLSAGIAVQAASYCEVPWQSFYNLCAKSPEFSKELVLLMARAQLATRQLLTVVRGRDAMKKLVGLLLNVSDRLRASGLQARDFRLGMSRAGVVDYLRLTSETVSRCFADLSTRGLIRVRAKHVELLQLDELQRMFGAEGCRDSLPAGAMR